MESEPTQQPNDNSTRQADSIGSEELDTAILAAVERANEVHSVESPAETLDNYIDAGFDIVPIDHTSPFNDGEDGFALMGDIDFSSLMGLMIEPSSYEPEDLTPQAPISEPVGEVLPQPQPDDAVLGGQKLAGASDAVLGGIEGVKRRLASNVVQQRIAAFTDALKYGQAGLDLVVQALKNESKSITQGIYLQFRDSKEPLAQQALQAYNPYRFLECIFSGRLRSGVTSIAISPDSQTLVCSTGTDIQVWNLHTGKWLRSLNVHSGTVLSLAISPDSQTLVSGNLDGTIELWNLVTGEQLRISNQNSARCNRPVACVAISRDGRTLVVGSLDGTISIIQIQKDMDWYKNKRLHTLKGDTNALSVALSPDGQTFVSGSRDSSIKLWNLQTGEEISALKKKHSSEVQSVAISPDGKTLVSGYHDGIAVWNLATGEHLHTIKESLSTVNNVNNSIAISPDSQTLVTGSRDRTVKIWNLTTGEQLHRLQGHSTALTSIAISPDGHNLASADEGGNIKVWGLP